MFRWNLRDVTLFGNRVLEDVIKVKLRGDQALKLGVGPGPNERVLIRNRNRTHRETQERRPREDRGRDWMMQPQAKGHLEPPEAGSGQEGQELMPPWGLLICGTSREYISIVNLWHFKAAAPCNEDTYHPKFSTLAP